MAAILRLQVLSMYENKLTDFINSFEKVVAETIHDDLLTPEIIIDAELSFKEINFSFVNIIDQMEPFGPANMRPVFISRNVKDTGYSKIIKEQHIRFVVQQHDKIFSGIGFNLAEKFQLLQNNIVDIIYTLEQNEWNGEKMIQLKIIDFRPSATA